ncbi:TadE family type IV pilus minor pilin [Arthrobacter sp. CJ23]|uniref:TadE family type IV pilus minor pilin n=1 Tax=Arthrobacter sp. CJ23 TaxID=2972479 RepID=UPI00215C63A1|nr:TadE family type IV pilus minor pilin [Arthrobacter sp. CJ23]UVJ38839.1 pilus assembly protein [Arthrobacter sp. CJ23]
MTAPNGRRAARPRPAAAARHPGPGKDRGAVTAEFAVALPAVLLLLAFLLAGSAAGVMQFRLEEAARAGARALARGESTGIIDDVVRRLAGQGATAVVAADGEWVTVTASARVPGPLGSVIPWTLSASASARGETPEASAAQVYPLGRSVPFPVLREAGADELKALDRTWGWQGVAA